MTDGPSGTVKHNPEALSRVELLYPFVPCAQVSRKLLLSASHEVRVKAVPCRRLAGCPFTEAVCPEKASADQCFSASKVVEIGKL